MLFIDFKQAFDSIDHEILEQKIRIKISTEQISLENGELLLQYLKVVYNENKVQIGEKIDRRYQVEMSKGVL